MPFVNERTADGEWQTIDRERGFVLRYLGGGRPQEPMDFELTVDGISFRFEAKRRTTNLHDIHKIHVEWDVWKVFIPPQIKRDKSEINKIVEESLRGFGFAASTDCVASLNVNFALNLL